MQRRLPLRPRSPPAPEPPALTAPELVPEFIPELSS